MRVISAAAVCLVLLVVARCKSKDRESPASVSPTLRQENLATDSLLLEAFRTGDVSALDSIISPAFVNHQAAGDLVGPDRLKAGIGMFHSKAKTIKLEVLRRWADDEVVSNWVRFSGTEPAFSLEGMEVTRYSNGKAVDHWFFSNVQNKP